MSEVPLGHNLPVTTGFAHLKGGLGTPPEPPVSRTFDHPFISITYPYVAHCMGACSLKGERSLFSLSVSETVHRSHSWLLFFNKPLVNYP